MAAYPQALSAMLLINPSMDIAVLLRESRREWHSNVDAARLYKLERRSQRLHEGLSRETASNFVRSSHRALPSNEKEISHGQGVVTSTLKLFCQWAVGFIWAR